METDLFWLNKKNNATKKLKAERELINSLQQENEAMKKYLYETSYKKTVSITLPSDLADDRDKFSRHSLSNNFSDFITKILLIDNIDIVLNHIDLFTTFLNALYKDLGWYSSIRDYKETSFTDMIKFYDPQQPEIKKILEKFSSACGEIFAELKTEIEAQNDVSKKTD